MPEMTSYRRNIGPWPIKRSQSVPDASNPIFTPRNSPPSLARLLAKVDEDCMMVHHVLAKSSSATLEDKDWSTYSMAQSNNDIERNEKAQKKQRLASKPNLAAIDYISLGGIIVCVATWLLLPFCVTYYVYGGRQSLPEIKLPEKGLSTTQAYCLICLMTTLTGATAAVMVRSLEMAMRRATWRRRDAWVMAFGALLFGITTAVWWIFLVLPPIVQG